MVISSLLISFHIISILPKRNESPQVLPLAKAAASSVSAMFFLAKTDVVRCEVLDVDVDMSINVFWLHCGGVKCHWQRLEFQPIVMCQPIAISKVINRNLVMFLFAMTLVHLASHVWQRRNISACQDHGR